MRRLFATLLLVCTSAVAQELKPVAAPDFVKPLEHPWSVRHGTWEVKDAVMTVSELPENKHAAVLWHQVPLQTGSVECEFQFDGAKVFILGCDGGKHIGRVVLSPSALRLVDDSTEVKGKSPGTVLATGSLDLKKGEWYRLRYEWSGERMSAVVGETRVEASHPNLGVKKERWWFAVGGAALKIRNVKVAGLE